VEEGRRLRFVIGFLGACALALPAVEPVEPFPTSGAFELLGRFGGDEITEGWASCRGKVFAEAMTHSPAWD
jgi:hypothetical protein